MFKRFATLFLSLTLFFSAVLAPVGQAEAASFSFPSVRIGSFARTLSSAEVIKMIVVDTGATVVTSSSTCSFPSVVDTSAWYYPYYLTACEEGWISSGAHLDPAVGLDRASVAKLVTSAHGISPVYVSTATYADVDTSVWFSPYVEALAAEGAIAVTSGNFRPADYVKNHELKYWLNNL